MAKQTKASLLRQEQFEEQLNQLAKDREARDTQVQVQQDAPPVRDVKIAAPIKERVAQPRVYVRMSADAPKRPASKPAEPATPSAPTPPKDKTKSKHKTKTKSKENPKVTITTTTTTSSGSAGTAKKSW